MNPTEYQALTRRLSAQQTAELRASLPDFLQAEGAARRAQAAADVTRIGLLAALRPGGELCVSDLIAVTGREQSVVSHTSGCSTASSWWPAASRASSPTTS